MKGVTVNIVRAFTNTLERSPKQKREFRFQPKINTARPKWRRRRKPKHPRPKR